MKRDVLSSPRLSELKKHRRRVFLNKIIALLGGFVIVVVFLAYISHLSSLNIHSIEVSGNKIVETDAIKTIVNQQITGRYFFFFPQTNILIYPKNNIVKNLQSNFQRLKNISLSVKNGVLYVSLSERTAAYTWCGNNVPDTASVNPTCYFVDQDGYIFDEAPYFSGEVYFILYGKTGSNNENPLGSYFFPSSFKQLISFKEALVGMGLKPVALLLTEDGDAQIFLSGGVTTVSGPKILFRANADVQNIAENLQAALNTEPLQTNFKIKYSKLLYIDLRFGNKVYDKFQ